MNISQIVDGYARVGLKPIPLYPKSKIPIGNDWNKKWHKFKAKEVIFQNPGCNIGTLLGNIIDIEADTKAGNELLSQLLAGTPHPIYRSHKSDHHLFWTFMPSFTRAVYQGIEIRGYKHQSVLPPSIHPCGEKYTWLETNNFNFPQVPEEFIRWGKKYNIIYQQKKSINKLKVFCDSCHKPIMMDEKRFNLELKAFKSLDMKWQCGYCKPDYIKELCKDMKKWSFDAANHERGQMFTKMKFGETELLEYLKETGLKFVHKRPIRFHKEFFFVDFYSNKHKVALQLISDSYTSPEQDITARAKDILELLKINLIEIEEKEIKNDFGKIKTKILEAVAYNLNTI